MVILKLYSYLGQLVFVALVHNLMKNDAQSTAFAVDRCNFTKQVLFRQTAAFGNNSKQSTGEPLSAALHTSSQFAVLN